MLTARILSLDFQVNSDAKGVSNTTNLEADFVDPEKSKQNIIVKLASDWTIELKAIDATKVNFRFCGKDLGSLSVDDQVTIDEKGNVKVNGQTRSQAAPAV